MATAIHVFIPLFIAMLIINTFGFCVVSAFENPNYEGSCVTYGFLSNWLNDLYNELNLFFGDNVIGWLINAVAVPVNILSMFISVMWIWNFGYGLEFNFILIPIKIIMYFCLWRMVLPTK